MRIIGEIKILKDVMKMDEKILHDEVMSDDELDGVAGGTRIDTYQDGDELRKRGLLSDEDALSSAPVRELLHKMGYAGYKDNGGLFNDNVYVNKKGETVSRDTFWKNFDAENGTKIIK